MNPLNDWYQARPELRDFMEQYYQAACGLLDHYPELGTDVDRMYASNVMDKLLALSLLAAVKRYFPLEL